MDKVISGAVWLIIAAGVLFGAFFLVQVHPVLWWGSAILAGIMLAFVMLGLATPLFIHALVNQPGDQDESGPHFFTFLEEGQAKWIVRGDRPVRAIMLLAGQTFAGYTEKGDHNPSHAEFWQIVPGDDRSPVKSWGPIGLWARYVYAITGAVFTGIYPWQKIREYPLERTKVLRDKKSEITLHVDDDFSDHFRVRQFIYNVRVAHADTKDKISVDVLVAVKARVVNPHKAAFGTDRWDVQLVNLVTNTITNFTRARDLDRVLTLKDESEAERERLNSEIGSIKADTQVYGIEIEGVDILDISPNLTEEEKTRLYAEALAKPEAAATRIKGEGQAAANKAIQDVVLEGGDVGLAVIQSENLVRAAEAAKGGAIILGAQGTQTPDPINVATLATLRKLVEETPRPKD